MAVEETHVRKSVKAQLLKRTMLKRTMLKCAMLKKCNVEDDAEA